MTRDALPLGARGSLIFHTMTLFELAILEWTGLSSGAHALLILSALLGAFQVMAPDHWVPISLTAWQRGWRPARIIGFGTLALLAHLLGGAAIYFAFFFLVFGPGSYDFAIFSSLLVIAGVWLRGSRFRRMNEVFRAGPKSPWGIHSSLAMLGPCEFLVPVLYKAGMLGIGYLTPFVFFAFGTCVTGVSIFLAAQLAWNRPQWLVRILESFYDRSAVAPVGAVAVLMLALLIRL